jgi:hypothetical protein
VLHGLARMGISVDTQSRQQADTGLIRLAERVIGAPAYGSNDCYDGRSPIRSRA